MLSSSASPSSPPAGTSNPTQRLRQVRFDSPLGPDVLLFERMTAVEDLSRPFEFEVRLLSKRSDIRPSEVLGQRGNVTLDKPRGGVSRYFNGMICRFEYVGVEEDFAVYHASLRPWLWLLTRNADCRIFQDKTVPDIIQTVFRDRGYSADFENKLTRSYRKWTYCVQYRETDFNFVCRLMEQEGIYYYFKHTDPQKHMLVLADSYSSHEPLPGYAKIPYMAPSGYSGEDQERIFDWTVAQEVQTGSYTLSDFDFEKPRAKLEARAKSTYESPNTIFMMYDYPGAYTAQPEGSSYAGVRIEEFAAQCERAVGKAHARGLAVGGLFTLEGAPRQDQDRQYLIGSATHLLQSDEYSTQRSRADAQVYRCTFTAMDAKQPFRAPQVTPKPVAHGPQTAFVVGPGGEEIWTDKYGRVKVQFHWDRQGKNDENSSCWIRVAQVWAGKQWGGMFIPRIGQEVIVDFLEGDPDQPIITGRVYNGENMPPYALPDDQTKSTLKSNSSKGGGGFNEIRFEDKKGSEEFYVHAQKDMNTLVLNDRTVEVKGDEKVKIDKTQKIDVGQTITVEAGQSITLKTGASSIVLQRDGTINIKGVNVTVEGQAQLVNKGMTVQVNGSVLTVVKGGLVQIN
jgi:type VI secretion system secreted protein VgrG